MLRQISRGLVCCVAALMLLGVSDAFAQGNPNAPGQQKRRANQVPDTGLDDTAAPAELAVDRTMNLPVTVHANGMLSAQLDETFMEASTVMVRADGTLEFQYFTGLDHARIAVMLHQFGGWKAFMPLAFGQPAAARLALEEQE